MAFDIKNTMMDPHGSPLRIDLFSSKDWQSYQLGVFAKQNRLPCSNTNAISFLDNVLKAAKEFRNLLKPRNIDYPPVLVVTSKSRPTIAKVKQSSSTDSTSWDFKTLPTEPGDGRIPEAATMPPEPIQYETHHSSYEHATMLNDPAVIERIFSFFK
jgi:hypothetical protein